MSIVPYNANSEIVYHDPNYGILVLHNNQQNSIQLLSTIEDFDYSRVPGASNESLSTPRFRGRERFSSGGPTNECPNCGFIWSSYQNHRRGQFPPPRRSASRGRDQRHSEDENELVHLAARELPQSFMHNDYFKVLANLPFKDDQNKLQENTVEEISSLPEDIFNQGYFNKFFQKIDPFVLGSGAHAQVYKVSHVLNGIQLGVYAVKRISIGDHSAYLDQVLNEVLILYELSTQGANENNLIRYNHVWLEMGDLEDSKTFFLSNDSTGHSAETSPKIPYVFILQQYCGGGHLEDLIVKNFQREKAMSLKEKLDIERSKRRQKKEAAVEPEAQPCHQKRWLTDLEIWKLFKDVANGVNYLHVHGILHRDLKPSNCLLESVYDVSQFQDIESFLAADKFEALLSTIPKVLVSDFGEGKFIDKQYIANKSLTSDENERRGNTGTLEFTAPELWLFANYDPSLLKDKQRFAYGFTYNSDIYSLGLILCWLCVGTLPFSSAIKDQGNPDAVREHIAQWYSGLSSSRFHAWFMTQIKETRGNLDLYSKPIRDFEKLIYLMIKGDDDTALSGVPDRISSSDVMKYLDAIKWKRFIKSGHKIREMGRNVFETSSYEEPAATHRPQPSGDTQLTDTPDHDSDELDEEEEEVVHDLTVSEESPPPRQNRKRRSSVSSTTLKYQQHFAVIFYVGSLIFADRAKKPFQLKLLLLLSLAADALLITRASTRSLVLLLAIIASLFSNLRSYGSR